MTAGKFINLPVLIKNFGKIRVRETGIELRKRDLFEKGWSEVDPLVAAHFLFALFATNSPKYALNAIENAYKIGNSSGNILVFIARILQDQQFRESIRYILVSRKNGNTLVYFRGIDLPEYLYRTRSGINPVDYDGFEFDDTQVDIFTRIDRNFFDELAGELSYSK